MTDKPKPVVFRALQLVHEQRNAYGLRSNDFQRYRKHCANRTHRLRSSLKMNHGKGREFRTLPPLKPDIATAGHLQLLLFEAERSWAFAQEIINASLQPGNQAKAGKLRHRATGRFRRAVNWSTQLLLVCQTLQASSRTSTENLIEAIIYTIILNSRFLRYRDDFEDALIQLSVARGLLDNLAATMSTSRDHALAIVFSDEIGPEIRYCAHQLGHKRAYDINGIVSDLSSKYRNQIVQNYDVLVSSLQNDQAANSRTSSTLRERMWDGQAIPVRHPELADIFLKVDLAELALDQSAAKKTKTGVTAYDGVLSVLSDAEAVARGLQEGQQFTPSSTSGNRLRDIHFVHAYIVYQLLSRRIQRDLLLINTLLASSGTDGSKGNKQSYHTSKPEFDSRLFPAVVKLLDTVIQSLAQMRMLSIVDDNSELASAVDTRLSITRGRRCSYLACCYSSVKRFSEALVLLQHAAIHIRETTSSLSPADFINEGKPPFFPLSKDGVQELEASITENSFQYKRDWFAYNGGSADTNPFYKKPLFFNIALNYINLDMDRLRERRGKETASIMGPTTLFTQEQGERKTLTKARVEEVSQEPVSGLPHLTRGRLSNLLGGWWK